MKLNDLEKYAHLLNKETITNPGERIFFTFLDDQYILAKLESNTLKGYKIDRNNIVQLFHLNMLQYLNYKRINEIEKEIFNILNLTPYEDIVIDGKVLISAKVLSKIKPHLIDIWLILTNKVITYKSLEKKIITQDICYSDCATFIKALLEFADDDKGKTPFFIVLVGNIERAIFMYDEYGYIKMIIEAGRIAQELNNVHKYKILETDINYLNNLLRFNSEKYTSILLLKGGESHE